jgi:hypothetical protein
MVQATRGPKAAAEKFYGAGKFPDNELPDMKALSDILWVAWQHVADKTFMDTFMMLTIKNAVTTSLIARAMNNAGVPLSVQPHRFWLPSDEALALLGMLTSPTTLFCFADISICSISKRRSICSLPYRTQVGSWVKNYPVHLGVGV